MKKLLILTTFLVASLFSYSQFYLGYSEASVRRQIQQQTNGNAFVVSSTYNGNRKALQWVQEMGNSIVYFNDQNISVLHAILIHKHIALKSVIEVLNENYVQITDTEWKAYIGSSIYEVTLQYNELKKQHVLFFAFSK